MSFHGEEIISINSSRTAGLFLLLHSTNNSRPGKCKMMMASVIKTGVSESFWGLTAEVAEARRELDGLAGGLPCSGYVKDVAVIIRIFLIEIDLGLFQFDDFEGFAIIPVLVSKRRKLFFDRPVVLIPPR